MTAAPRPRASAVALALVAVVLAAGIPSASAATELRILDGDGGRNGRVTAAGVGGSTAFVDFEGEQHLFYSVVTEAGDVRLRHAAFAEPTTFETIDGTGNGIGATSHDVGGDLAAQVFGGRMHVFYQDLSDDVLRHAWSDGDGWRRETLDGLGGGDGRVEGDVGTSVQATVSEGRLRVVYLDTIADDVRIAVFNGDAWRFRTLDGAGGPRGRTSNPILGELALATYAGAVHVFAYECDPAYDCAIGWIREAVWDGDRWSFGRAFRANAGDANDDLEVAVLDDDDVAIGYVLFDPQCGSCEPPLAMAVRRWDGTSWSPVDLLLGSYTVIFEMERSGEDLVAAASADGAAQYVRWPDGDPTFESATRADAVPIGSAQVDDAAWFFWAVPHDGRAVLGVSRGV